MRQKLEATEGKALRINWCGAKKINICWVPSTDQKMRQKLFLSLVKDPPHKLVWHPAGIYVRGTKPKMKNCPAECSTGRIIRN